MNVFKRFAEKLLLKDVLLILVLLITTFLIPISLNVRNLTIYKSLYESIDYNNQGLIIITSFKVVAMNAIRILPIYMTAYSLMEIIEKKTRKMLSWIEIICCMLVIPIQYYIIKLIYGIQYHFGVTSIVVMMSMVFLFRINLSRISIVKKVLFVILLLMGLQWIDIIPFLSNYGFGKGEVSMDVKLVAEFIQADEAMGYAAIVFTFFFIIISIVILKLIKDQNTIIITLEQKNQMEVELKEMQLQSLRSRSFEEMQNLVHDLKSPLTAIQALVSFSEMLLEDKVVVSYMQKINLSVDQLNDMISEILNEDKRTSTSITELLRGILSQISPLTHQIEISFENRLKGCTIEVNRIRFSRMIINLINNSLAALEFGNGYIRIVAYEENDNIVFKIIDNGNGIELDHLNKIRERGFSTKGSSGIGLRYVEEVVANHGGTLKIESQIGIGTEVFVILNKEEIGYEEVINN